jgi:hypothetical protein
MAMRWCTARNGKAADKCAASTVACTSGRCANLEEHVAAENVGTASNTDAVTAARTTMGVGAENSATVSDQRFRGRPTSTSPFRASPARSLAVALGLFYT